MRLPLLLLLVVSSLCVLAACPAQKPVLKRLVIATTVEPDTLCPLLTDSGTAQEVIELLARDLVVEDPSWAPVPDLASAIPEGKTVDGKTVVTWKIKDDATWEDGVPVTAADFIYGWGVQKDPAQVGVAGRDDALRIDTMVPSTDGRSFTVTWHDENPFYAATRVHRPLPSHVLLGRLGDGKMRQLKDDPIARKPMSNGPFRLVEWKPGEHLLFARNDHYRPRPALDEVLVKIVPSTMGILTMLQSGDVDAAFAAGGPSPVEAKEFVDAHPGFAVESAAGEVWAHIDFNLDDPAFKDVEVRRAIAMAIPRDEINRSVSHGMYETAQGYLPPRHWGFTALAPIAYDAVKARAVLADKHLKLTLSGASGSKEAELLVTLVRDALVKAGVDVTLDLRPFKVFFSEGAKKRKVQMAFYSWTLDTSSTGIALWGKDRIPSEENGWKGQNFPGWKNDEATSILERAERTIDVTARKALVVKAQQLVRDDMPAVPMYFRPVVVVHRRSVTGLQPTGTLTPLAWNASQWDVAR